MKRKNGFTLIELLAVIVILAIIAVIATPIIVGIIEDSRKAAFERSVEGIIHATDIDFGTQETLANNSYTISNGVLNKTLKTPIKNIEGFNGTIKYDEKGNSEYAIHNDKWCMKKDSDGTTTTIEYINGGCTMPGTMFTITYNLNGGTQGSGAITSFTEETETFDLPIPTKTGNTFKGWYETEEFVSEEKTQITKGTVENKIYYAKWEEIVYTLTVNPNGGKINNLANVQTYTIKYGETKEIALDTSDEYALYRWLITGTGSSISGTTFTMGEANASLIAELKHPYENGYPVYYDVVNGGTCTNYHEDNSKTGYNGIESRKTTENQTSCLKFYAFNYEDGDDIINLILDHNTTAEAYWTDYFTTYNTNGPDDVIRYLQNDTSSWFGTEVPENYQVSQENGGNYTIDYSTYKARLITANEVAKIIGNTSFNENTSGTSNVYFDDDSCRYSGDNSCYRYGWLYDRSDIDCVEDGCLNNSDISLDSYWTATSVNGDSLRAYSIRSYGRMDGVSGVRGNEFGIRPVIEVLVSNL